MKRIRSWGRLTNCPHLVVDLSERTTLRQQLASTTGAIPHGMGRSYGDVCLNPGGYLWRTAGLDHYIQLDLENGILECEAGVLLKDIQQRIIPRGWSLPVTPGTQLITVGGAIANDVHGKNHHRHGSFGNQLIELSLLRTDGEQITCGPKINPTWFHATVGGMGLTGLITTAKIQLSRVPGPWLETETTPYYSLDEFFDLADSSEANWEHTVSWIDCINRDSNRGLFMRGNPIESDNEPPARGVSLGMPLTPPVSLVNRLSLKAFNNAYFARNKEKTGKRTTHYESFFYPLDNINHWNRMYGPKGFFQYQSVVPRESGAEAVKAMLNAISLSGKGSFLAVLKTFGERQSAGLMSFPQPGVTLALDFPNGGEKTLRLFDYLDDIVREAGGRLYPAKDARMPRDLFKSGYPELDEFLKFRDPGLTSALSRRLIGY